MVPMLVQDIYVLFTDDRVMKLQYFIAVAGIICALFAISIPYLSALRIWLGFSTIFSLLHMVIEFSLYLKMVRMLLISLLLNVSTVN